jgi:hypothetical protein
MNTRWQVMTVFLLPMHREQRHVRTYRRKPDLISRPARFSHGFMRVSPRRRALLDTLYRCL